MYRAIALFGSTLLLAACSVNAINLDTFKPAPLLDEVRLESEPPGAEAKSSSGQTCVTPCTLALPTDVPVNITFTRQGYLPDTQNLQVVQADTFSPPRLTPNPLRVQMAMAPPPPPPKPVKRRTVTKKPVNAASKPASKPASTQTFAEPVPDSDPAPAPVVTAPPPQQTLSPWPDPPPPQR